MLLFSPSDTVADDMDSGHVGRQLLRDWVLEDAESFFLLDLAVVLVKELLLKLGDRGGTSSVLGELGLVLPEPDFILLLSGCILFSWPRFVGL